MDAKADDCLKSDKSNAPTSEENFQSKFDTFHADALKIAKNRGKRDSLEAMARIVESASEVFNGDWEDMMKALGMVFLGLPINKGPYSGQGTLFYADTVNDPEYYENANFPSYFLGQFFYDGGFNPHYQDGGNQIYHVWGYIANATVLHSSPADVSHARNEALWANNYHELNFKETGRSREDFLLSLAGINIGNQISQGSISPYTLGDVLRSDLGDNTTVNNGFIWQYWILPSAK